MNDPDREDDMPDPPLNPGSRDHTGTPRWVKVVGIAVAVVVLALAAMLLAGGNHGPSRHTPSDGGTGGHTPPAGGH